jgi:3-dehydrotetronate 4-kinase
MLLGCIADDFTGATDLANNLVRGGMRTIQTIGVPRELRVDDVDAVVVALKSRTTPAADAVAQSLAALDYLRAGGARQIYFKYCSTFDSTPAGNIGPVTEALMAALWCDFTIACPAFPENGRTVFRGHLFVGDELLSESGMRDHPLTPMRDSNLVRVLQAQTKLKVGHIAYDVVALGKDAIHARMDMLAAHGTRIAIVDAISDEDLIRLGPALRGMPLVTAGSGVAIGLPQNFELAHRAEASALPELRGHRAIVSGSCSLATNAQVHDFVQRGGAAFALDPLKLAAGENEVERAIDWALPRLLKGPLLIYSTAALARVADIQREVGTADAGTMIERALAAIAHALVGAGVTQLVVAGGETSGAVVQALGATALRIGPQIDPGVPWTATEGSKPILLALKSGNFGAPDFFTKCFTLLDSHERSQTA